MTRHGRRVLIKTLDLYNGNYGGILQNFALQHALDDLGHEAWTDVRHRSAARRRAKGLVKTSLRRFAPPGAVPVSLAGEGVNAALTSFVRDRIRTADVHRAPAFDAFVTGSDQVWRHAYTDVRENLFDFAEAAGRTKVAYAASFGTDNLDEYPPDLRVRSRELARELSAVSVREASAVRLCAEEWGVEATHVLDPTMLLDTSVYDSLIEAATRPAGRTSPAAPYLFEYVLDPSDACRDLRSALVRELGLEVRHGMPPVPSTFAKAKRSPQRYAKPPIEDWLRGFRDARFVMTDSFHGTVFSILFERPFLSVVNATRGAERFHSLLSTFGLEDRLWVDGDPAPRGLDEPVDWSAVREVLATRRAESVSFLRTALAGHG